MASILVTGCEEDGADQSANAAFGLTSPCPRAFSGYPQPRRVHMHGNRKDRFKNRASPARPPRGRRSASGAPSRRYIPDGQAHTRVLSNPGTDDDDNEPEYVGRSRKAACNSPVSTVETGNTADTRLERALRIVALLSTSTEGTLGTFVLSRFVLNFLSMAAFDGYLPGSRKSRELLPGARWSRCLRYLRVFLECWLSRFVQEEDRARLLRMKAVDLKNILLRM